MTEVVVKCPKKLLMFEHAYNYVNLEKCEVDHFKLWILLLQFPYGTRSVVCILKYLALG